LMAIELHGATASQAVTGSDLFGDALEESRGGMGIGVDEDEPITGCSGSAAVSCAGDLVEGFEHDPGAGGSGDFGGFIGRVIVANDEFRFPAPLMKRRKSGVDMAKGFAEVPFFVESRDNGGDFQMISGGSMAEVRRGSKLGEREGAETSNVGDRTTSNIEPRTLNLGGIKGKRKGAVSGDCAKQKAELNYVFKIAAIGCEFNPGGVWN